MPDTFCSHIEGFPAFLTLGRLQIAPMDFLVLSWEWHPKVLSHSIHLEGLTPVPFSVLNPFSVKTEDLPTYLTFKKTSLQWKCSETDVCKWIKITSPVETHPPHTYWKKLLFPSYFLTMDISCCLFTSYSSGKVISWFTTYHNLFVWHVIMNSFAVLVSPSIMQSHT